jgi:hypothetical protein
VTAKISREVIGGYLNCKYKAHLKQAGEQGTQSDYEALLLERRGEVRLQAIDKILASHKEQEVAHHVPLTAASLKRGPLFVLDATLEDDHVCMHFDGLKRVDGASKLGDFHYVPVLFFEGRQVRKQQRALLDVYGLLISRLQGRAPGCGIIWHGKECRATRVRLNPDPRKAERVAVPFGELRRPGVGVFRLHLRRQTQVLHLFGRQRHLHRNYPGDVEAPASIRPWKSLSDCTPAPAPLSSLL